jgi:hypothetical protein
VVDLRLSRGRAGAGDALVAARDSGVATLTVKRREGERTRLTQPSIRGSLWPSYRRPPCRAWRSVGRGRGRRRRKRRPRASRCVKL